MTYIRGFGDANLLLRYFRNLAKVWSQVCWILKVQPVHWNKGWHLSPDTFMLYYDSLSGSEIGELFWLKSVYTFIPG